MADIRVVADELFAELTSMNDYSPQDRKMVEAFCFTVGKRAYLQERALSLPDGEDRDDLLKREAAANSELRAWSEKRPDLFGDKQRMKAEELEDKEQEAKLLAFKARAAK